MSGAQALRGFYGKNSWSESADDNQAWFNIGDTTIALSGGICYKIVGRRQDYETQQITYVVQLCPLQGHHSVDTGMGVASTTMSGSAHCQSFPATVEPEQRMLRQSAFLEPVVRHGELVLVMAESWLLNKRQGRVTRIHAVEHTEGRLSYRFHVCFKEDEVAIIDDEKRIKSRTRSEISATERAEDDYFVPSYVQDNRSKRQRGSHDRP